MQDPNILQDYREYLFSGFRFNSRAWRFFLAFTIFLKLADDTPEHFNSKFAGAKSFVLSYYFSEPLLDCPSNFVKHIKAYSQWHAATLTSLKVVAETTPKRLHGSLPLPVAIVVYRCGLTDDCGGLGDRLCGITAMFYHYGLRLGSLFLIDMPAWKGSVRPATFNWEFPGLIEESNSWLSAYTNITSFPQVANMLNGHCLNLAKGFPCIYALDSSHYNNISSKETIKPGVYFAISNRGVWSTPGAQGDGSWFMHRQLISQFGLDDATWGCLYRSIIWPTKSTAEEISADIAPFLKADVSLCVHHRSGDSNMRSQGSNGVSDSFFLCTREALQFLNGSEATQNQTLGVKFKFWNGQLSGEKVHIFLSADSTSIKEAGTALLGMPGITVSSTNLIPQHSNWKEVDGNYHIASPEEAMRSSLRDWFILGACPAFSSEMYSGFVRTASAFSRSETFYAPFPDSKKCQGFRNISPWLGMGSGL